LSGRDENFNRVERLGPTRHRARRVIIISVGPAHSSADRWRIRTKFLAGTPRFRDVPACVVRGEPKDQNHQPRHSIAAFSLSSITHPDGLVAIPERAPCHLLWRLLLRTFQSVISALNSLRDRVDRAAGDSRGRL
jgi:hypothetical protein